MAANYRILLIGNSFSWDVKDPLLALIRSAGNTATINVRVPEKSTLAFHASDPATLKSIRTGNYDFVVMQEQSDGCTAGGSYPAIRTLNTEIRNAGGLPVLMMTWRNRGQLPAVYDTLKGTQGDSDGPGYVPIAFEIDAAIAPAGWFFRTAVVEQPKIQLWNTDGHHANARGKYFAALADYCAIFGTSPVGLKCPKALLANAAHDQGLANTVAITGKATWNIS